MHAPVLADPLARSGVWALRAAAVADGEGAVTLLLPGRGVDLAVVARAVARCAGLVSADVVGVDASGSVVPPRSSPPHDAGGETRRGGLPATLRAARLIVVEERMPEHGTPSVTADEVAASLVAASVDLRAVPAPLRRMSEVLHACARERCTPDTAADRAESPISAQEEPTSRWVDDAPPPADVRRSADPSPARVPLYHRGAALGSGVLADGRYVVLMRRASSTELLVLGGERAALWRNADGVERSALEAAEAEIDACAHAGLLDGEPAWRTADGAAWVTVGSRTTVISAAAPGAPAVVLEGSARMIWAVLAEERVITLSGLVRRCTEMFDVDAEQISASIRAMVHELAERGAVVRV